MALDDVDSLPATYTDADRAALADVPPEFRVNLGQLARIIGRSENSIRMDLQRHGDGFPIVVRGSNGRDYAFDARSVVGFYRELEERAEAERVAEEERIKGLRLALIGDSVDTRTADLSPKDRAAVLQAEYHAGKIAEQRRELVRAADVEDAARTWSTAVRQEMTLAGAEVAEKLDLDRDARALVERLINAGLRRAAARAASLFGEGEASDAA